MPATTTHNRIADTAAGRPIARPFNIVICTGCEAVEHVTPGQLPNDWALEEVADQTFAFCAGCAIDLPQEPVQ
jgi:hypothetical protein